MLIHAKAAWVRGRELARDVLLEIAEGRISGIRTGASSDDADVKTDLLLPGFINAHCHLEYTALAGKLPRGKVPFGEWLDAIVSAKGELSEAEIKAGIESGVRQLIGGGCTTVVDST